MNDQAAALRRLVEEGGADSPGVPFVEEGEVWAMAGGCTGVGVRTIAENFTAALQRAGRKVSLWDYSRARFTAADEADPGSIALALLAGCEHQEVWHTARHALLVTGADPPSVAAAFERLKQLGPPARSAAVRLVINQVRPSHNAAEVQQVFDRAARKFLGVPAVLAAVVPRVSGWPTAGEAFPEGSPAARAVRGAVSDLSRCRGRDRIREPFRV